MSLSEPLVIEDGLLQRPTPDTAVQCNRFALSPPVPIIVTGDFTMTASVHVLNKGTPGNQWVNISNITGMNQGEILLLFSTSNRIRFKSNGNIALPNNFRLNPFKSVFLYWSGGMWRRINDA